VAILEPALFSVQKVFQKVPMAKSGRPKKEDAAKRIAIYDPAPIDGLLDAEKAFFGAAKAEIGRAYPTERSDVMVALLCRKSLTDSNLSVWRGNGKGGKEPPELARDYAEGLRLEADRVLANWDAKLRAPIQAWWQEEDTTSLRRALAGLLDQYVSEVSALEREERRAKLREAARRAEQARPDRVTLNGDPLCHEIVEARRLPHWMADRIIDGCIELAGSPDGTRQYSGYSRDKVHCHQTREPWDLERSVTNPNLVRRTMIRNLRSWKKQEATPGPVTTLVRAFRSPVTDCQEYRLEFGQGDYFTVRTIKEIASTKPLATGLGSLFAAPSWWADDDEALPTDSPPFHVSAQATVLNCDPDTGSFGILVTAHDPSGRPLAAGASFSIEEQTKPPAGSPWPTHPWWSDEYKRGYEVDGKRGDQHIFDTLKRGLREELGIREGDYADPLLLRGCLENRI